jgi:NAD(P)-dependent dehydrogenase (short-subunit alcohol dehydrogenase family)
MTAVSMANKRCLVLASTMPTSVGYVTAQAFLEAGAAAVVVLGRDKARLDAAVETLGKHGGCAWMCWGGIHYYCGAAGVCGVLGVVLSWYS